MRITFIMPKLSLAGGIRVIVMLGRELHRAGHQVLLLSPPLPRPRFRTRVKSFLLGRGWSPPHPDAEYYDTSYLELGTEVEHRLLRHDGPLRDRDLPDGDVVVATWWETAEWVARLSPRKGAKVYFVQQLESMFGGPRERIEATWRLPVQKIACAQCLADIARDQFGDPTAVVVPVAIDRDLFTAPPRGKQPRPTVGFMYAPGSAVKGAAAALAAIKLASERVPGLHVRAFGRPPVQPHLPLPPGAEYTRRPPQRLLPQIYAGCDVFLCASSSEAFAAPPCEALCCRTPVVSTRVGGPIYVIEDGVNGHLVDVGDVEGLADRLVRVLTADEVTWRRLSDAAYNTRRDYTWKEAAKLFELGLEQALAREGACVPG
jgi:glycosyltransferase involved in cell wall biosynthesis